jgi:hypothetical protein
MRRRDRRSPSPTQTGSVGLLLGTSPLSDNLGERTVTVGNHFGRRFSGTHGDGTLPQLVGDDQLRDRPLAAWHSLCIVSIGHHGGGRYAGGIISRVDQVYENLRLRTSDRSRATSEHPSLLFHPRQQYVSSGFRFVRTASREDP